MHARGGARAQYAPVQSVAGRPIDPGSARTLAEVYTDVLGITELYAADLDAILHRRPQHNLTKSLTKLRTPLWLDAGIKTVDDARDAMGVGAHRTIVALETLPSFDALSAICAALGDDRVVFSLDVRDGNPILNAEAQIESNHPPEELARMAAVAGASAVIVLDLARVGTGSGIDCDLLERVRASAPDVTLVAGGGVRGWDDLVQLSSAGCDAALVATALHIGSIGAAEISAARTL